MHPAFPLLKVNGVKYQISFQAENYDPYLP